MRHVFLTGGIAGLLFGFLGIVTISFLAGERDMIGFMASQEIIRVTIVGLIFSFLFGGRAALKIKAKNHRAGFCGIASSFLTTTCTVITLGLLRALSFADNLQDIVGMIFMVLIYSFFFGGIPMILLGSLFGFTVNELIHRKNIKK